MWAFRQEMRILPFAFEDYVLDQERRELTLRGQVVALDSPEAVRADPVVQAAYWQAEDLT